MNANRQEALPSRPARTRPMLIGQLARLTGRSVHTIRWYESQRLIPGVRRDLQHRRTYVRGHVDWLDLLDRLRRTGMSIRQMREYTTMVNRGGEGSLREQRALMQAHRQRIEAMMDDLTVSLALIDSKIDFYSEWLETGCRPGDDCAVRTTKKLGRNT